MPDTPTDFRCAAERDGRPSFENDQDFETFPGTVKFTTPLLFRPSSRWEVANAIILAEKAGHRVRAFGTKWSFSDAVVPAADGRYGAMIATDRMKLDLGDELSKIAAPGVDTSRLCYVQAGMKSRDLIALLAKRDLMLEAGGASGQSIAGMMSTSTHGSDSSVKPFVDCVRAIHLVGAAGVEYWIERDSAITDPQKLEKQYPCLVGGNIRYKTDLFNAVLVSAGSMGVICSVIIEAVPRAAMRTHRFATTWEELLGADPNLEGVQSGNYLQGKYLPSSSIGVRHDILDLPVRLDPPFAPNIFSQVLINPYPFYSNDSTLSVNEQRSIGQHLCVVANHVKLTGPVGLSTPSPSIDNLDAIAARLGLDALRALHGNPDFYLGPLPGYHKPGAGPDVTRFANFSRSIDGLSPSNKAAALVDFLADHYAPGTISAVIHSLMQATLPLGSSTVINPSVGLQWKDPLQGFCVEGAFPVSQGIEYTQRVLALVASYAERSPRVYVGGYLALRITGIRTSALLGMQQWTPTCHVEYLGVSGTRGIAEFVTDLQTIALSCGGILHFGLQNDVMTAADMRRLFGNKTIDKFRSARGELSNNGAWRTFDNGFTDRLGLSARKVDTSYLTLLLS